MSAAHRSKLFIAIIIAVPALITCQLPNGARKPCGGENQLRCKTGNQCIDNKLVCDGLVDCIDGSDEVLCSNKYNAVNCILPKSPENGEAYCRGKGCPPTAEDNSVPSGFQINFGCNEGYSIRGYALKNCINGAWYPSGATTCSDSCLVRASAKLMISCFYGNKWMDCRKPLPSGSVARFKCRDSLRYFMANNQGRSECRGGRWTREFPDSLCRPICGRTVNVSAPTDRSMVPWHVGIYEKYGERRMNVICGGSLISDQVVLSAAHCFRREDDGDSLFETVDKLMKVGLGKLYRGLTDKRDAKYQVTVDIEKVAIHPGYTGVEDYYSNDISLVFLAKPITRNVAIQPVCLDLSGDGDQLWTGNIGLVAGWGETESDTSSEILRVAYIPYVDRNECLNNTGLYNYVTSDKICGGDIDDDAAGTCKGDTGGGYAFFDSISKSFYLRGISSKGNQNCNGEDYAFFTKVSKHADFIISRLNGEDAFSDD